MVVVKPSILNFKCWHLQSDVLLQTECEPAQFYKSPLVGSVL